MDFKLILLVFGIAFGLGSCGDVRNSADGMVDTADNLWKGKHTLSVTFTSHNPYCGGAAPTPELENGIIEPLANQVFYIYKDERPASATEMIKVTSDDQGKFSIDLKEGEYSIIHGDKALPIDEFIKKKKIDGTFYEYSDDACFETWRLKADFTINLTESTDEKAVIRGRCFTGDNPCMEYTGPYPP